LAETQANHPCRRDKCGGMHQLRDSCVSSEWAPACCVRRMGKSLLVLSHEFDDVEKISARYEEFPNQQRHASLLSGQTAAGQVCEEAGSSANRRESRLIKPH